MEHVELEEEAPHRWRWIYSDGNGGRVASNASYPSALEAMLSARAAYPDLPLDAPQREVVLPQPDKTRRWLVAALVAVVLAILVVIGLDARARRKASS
jgi:hypothetical protein